MGTKGTLIFWGKVERPRYSDSESFELYVGSKPLCGCLLPFSGEKVWMLRVFSESPITLAELPEIYDQISGVVEAAPGYEEAGWSEMTPGCWFPETGCVGGHNLVEEFSHYLGQYALVIVSTECIDLNLLLEEWA